MEEEPDKKSGAAEAALRVAKRRQDKAYRAWMKANAVARRTILGSIEEMRAIGAELIARSEWRRAVMATTAAAWATVLQPVDSRGEVMKSTDSKREV